MAVHQDTALPPPPLRGRVGEGGKYKRSHPWTPTPNPSPQGGGERAVLAATFLSSMRVA
jgi:hypothetical protein